MWSKAIILERAEVAIFNRALIEILCSSGTIKIIGKNQYIPQEEKT
jgi:hypothetical protein